MKNNNIDVSLRINTDLQNYYSFSNLFQILKEEGLIDLPISFGHLRDYNNPKLCCTDVPQFNDIFYSAQNLLYKYKNKQNKVFNYPSPAKPCVANCESVSEMLCHSLNIGLTNDLCYGSCQPYCYCPDCRCNGLKIGAMNTTEIEVS